MDIHGYLSSPESKTAFEQALADRRLAKARGTVTSGGIAAATARYAAEASPGVIVIETEEGPDAIFQSLERLAEVCETGTNLVLIGPHNDVMFYRELTKRGVREYIPGPAQAADLLEALIPLCTTADDANLGRLISVIAASGGAGSTTVANNLAWTLGKLYDGEAILLDLDLVFGTVSLDFNLESPLSSAQAVAQAERFDDQMLERFLVKYNDNLSLLTGPGDCNNAADIDPAALDQLMRTLQRNAAWVVADLPHYWGGWVRHVLDASSDIVLTAVPTLASLRNAKSVVDTLNARRKTDTAVQVVLNRVGANPKTDIPVKDFANTLGSEPAATVPNEPVLFSQAANAGQMVGERAKAERVLEPFNKLASLVSGRKTIKKQAGKHGLLGRMRLWSK